MPPLSETKRNLLLVRHTTDNKRDLVATLAKGRERVEARIVKAARAKNFATSRRIRDGIYKDISQEYKRLQGDLDKWSTRSINNTMRPWFDLAQADLAATAADKAAASFAKFSSAHVEEYFERIHPFNAERLAAVNVHLNPQLTRMLDTDVRALRSAVVDTFRESLIEGGTAADRYQMLSKRVMDYADNPKSWQFIAKNGKRWKKGNYFDMLNRTVSANVARDSYHDALADEGHDLVELIGGLSSNSHDACVQWVGTVFSMTGATKGYPALGTYEAAGGFHPNCVHITVMATEAVKGQAKGIAEDAPDDAVPVASTIEEAERIAVEAGIADKVDYRKITNVDVANAVNAASSRMVKKYGHKYDKIRAAKQTSAQNAGTPMYHRARIKPDGSATHELVVNEGYFGRFGSTEEIIKDIAASRTDQWWIARNIEDLAVHEYAHRLTAVKMYKAQQGKTFVRPGGLYDYKNLGRYASSNADEAVAEVFNRYHQDGFIKPEWRVLFNESSEVPL